MNRQWLKKKLYFLRRNSWVLMYHRVSKEGIDPWDLCVEPEIFEAQLKWYKKNCKILSLDTLIDNWRENKLKPHSIAITFDDGYLDNYTQAKPLLEKYNLPASFFITSGNTIDQSTFWWDQLAEIILKTEILPGRFSIHISEEIVVFDIFGEEHLTPPIRAQLTSWRFPQPSPNKRAELYYQLWFKLRGLPANEQKKILKELQSAVAIENIPVTAPVMNAQQVKELSLHPLFSIEAHTVSHPFLAGTNENIQANEIRENKQTLESITEKKVKFISYPYGSYDDNTLMLAKEESFTAALTTQPAPLQKTSNPFLVGRMNIVNSTDYKRDIW